MRLAMIYQRMRVGMLPCADDIQPVNPTLRAFMIERHVDVVTRKPRAERDSRRVVAAVATQARLRRRHMKSLRAFALHFVMIQPRSFRQH